MSTDRTIEDLLLETLDAVSRFRVGQREAVTAALDAGGLLTEAKARLPHGSWGEWLQRVGLAPRTASTWMKLAGLGLTAAEVIGRGGLNAAARGRKAPESASEADPEAAEARALIEAEAQVGASKDAYYAALSERKRALRALAHNPHAWDDYEALKHKPTEGGQS